MFLFYVFIAILNLFETNSEFFALFIMASINILSLFIALNACLSMLFAIKLILSDIIIEPLNCHHEFAQLILFSSLSPVNVFRFYFIFTRTLLLLITTAHCRFMNYLWLLNYVFSRCAVPVKLSTSIVYTSFRQS